MSRSLREAPGTFLGAFVALQFAFNKAFSYLHVWIGPLPLFVTEAVLAVIVAAWLLKATGQRPLSILEDRIVAAAFALYLAIGLIGLAPALQMPRPELIQTLKRSALFYYAFFGVAAYGLFSERSNLERFMRIAFAGSVVSVLCGVADVYGAIPEWWPRSVGISENWARAYCLTYCLFIGGSAARRWPYVGVGALAAAALAFTSIRSVYVSVLVTSVVGVFLIKGSPVFQSAKLASAFVACAALASVFFWVQRHEPQASRRFEGMIRESSKKKADSEAPPPSLSLEASNDPSKLADEELKVPAWVASLEGRLGRSAQGGNAVWRVRVWTEGISSTLRDCPIVGHGMSRPAIMRSVSPYGTPERREAAIQALKARYSFINRIQSKTKSPSADVVPNLPIDRLPGETGEFYSIYWYDIDFHNSYVAIFYRLGMTGFAAYAVLVLICLTRLWRLARRREPVAETLLLFLVFGLTAAAFNVVLEGPFMGSVFWIFLGASFGCHVSAQRNRPHLSSGAPK